MCGDFGVGMKYEILTSARRHVFTPFPVSVTLWPTMGLRVPVIATRRWLRITGCFSVRFIAALIS